ncbi:MAG: ABC transporter permease [Actinobacteria bacterium]|nr:ABC transporter permease [Actinomycetota bacterium]
MSTVDAAVDVAAEATPAQSRMRLAAVRDYGIVVSFVILFVVLCFASDAFLSKTNLLNILSQWSPTLIMAAAATIVFASGGFDLSIGSIFGLAGVVVALLVDDVGIPLAVAAGIGAGAACGLFNGLLMTVGRINPFIATLATMMMILGVAYLLSDGNLIAVTSTGFSDIGNGELLGVTYTVWIAAVFIIACSLLLSRTVFGRFVYAVGGNPEAAWLSGIGVNRVRMVAFILSGVSAALAGIIVASRISTGQADAGGLNLALDALTGVILGGASLAGGEGTIWRTVVGVLLLALIGNGFNLIGVDATYQRIVQGGIILAAVGLDAWVRTSPR